MTRTSRRCVCGSRILSIRISLAREASMLRNGIIGIFLFFFFLLFPNCAIVFRSKRFSYSLAFFHCCHFSSLPVIIPWGGVNKAHNTPALGLFLSKDGEQEGRNCVGRGTSLSVAAFTALSPLHQSTEGQRKRGITKRESIQRNLLPDISQQRGVHCTGLDAKAARDTHSCLLFVQSIDWMGTNFSLSRRGGHVLESDITQTLLDNKQREELCVHRYRRSGQYTYRVDAI